MRIRGQEQDESETRSEGEDRSSGEGTSFSSGHESGVMSGQCSEEEDGEQKAMLRRRTPLQAGESLQAG